MTEVGLVGQARLVPDVRGTTRERPRIVRQQVSSGFCMGVRNVNEALQFVRFEMGGPGVRRGAEGTGICWQTERSQNSYARPAVLAAAPGAMPSALRGHVI